jgi:hypothetical protein
MPKKLKAYKVLVQNHKEVVFEREIWSKDLLSATAAIIGEAFPFGIKAISCEVTEKFRIGR